MGRSRSSSPVVPSRTPTREGPSSIKDGRVFRGGPRRSGSSSGEGIRIDDKRVFKERRRKIRDRKKDGDRPTIGPGSPGFSCPDPSMNILLADGCLKKAGDLKVGDEVKTYHEKDLEKEGKLARHKSLVLSSGGVEKHSQLIEQLENSYTKASLGEYKVEYVNIVRDVEKIKLTFEGSEIICSLTHKFYVNDSWKEARDMVIGDKVSDKKLVAIEDVEDGDVVHITIKDAHTYICEGLLSHNKRRLPPKGSRGRRGGRKGGYDPKSGVRYTDTGVPTAVQGTVRVPVQDPTLGGLPEREVPMPRERRQRITRESDPRGGAPFSPDERGMARDRFFERMFDRAEEKKQERSIRREERGETSRAMRDERSMRRNEPGEIDINAERGGRRRRRGGGMRRRRGRRRDFTRKRSQMEGGRRGRSREERAAFRDRYVSTLR